MADNLSIAVHTFARRMLTSLVVNEILLPMYVNYSANENYLIWLHVETNT